MHGRGSFAEIASPAPKGVAISAGGKGEPRATGIPVRVWSCATSEPDVVCRSQRLARSLDGAVSLGGDLDRLTDGYPQQLSPDLEGSMREGTLDLRPAFAEMGPTLVMHRNGRRRLHELTHLHGFTGGE
jgi:hypothetical protein